MSEWCQTNLWSVTSINGAFWDQGVQNQAVSHVSDFVTLMNRFCELCFSFGPERSTGGFIFSQIFFKGIRFLKKTAWKKCHVKITSCLCLCIITGLIFTSLSWPMLVLFMLLLNTFLIKTLSIWTSYLYLYIDLSVCLSIDSIINKVTCFFSCVHHCFQMNQISQLWFIDLLLKTCHLFCSLFH